MKDPFEASMKDTVVAIRCLTGGKACIECSAEFALCMQTLIQLYMRLDDDSDKKEINLPWWGNIA